MKASRQDTVYIYSIEQILKSGTASFPLPAVKVLDQLRERIRFLHYGIRMEETFVRRVRSFIRFHDLRHLATMSGEEVEQFLSHFANSRPVAASKHKEALSALLFFCGKVLGMDLPWMKEIGRPRTRRRLPVVLSPDEVARILCFLEGDQRLFAQLLHGTGMRSKEGLPLRVNDVDFGRSTIIVREGKGGKDCAVMLPKRLIPGLRDQMARARLLWTANQEAGRGGVAMPDALGCKSPRAGARGLGSGGSPRIPIPSFPGPQYFAVPIGMIKLSRRAFKRALSRTGIAKAATPHSLRHSLATAVLQAGHDLRAVQELPGRSGVTSTMIHTRVLKVGGGGARSPMDSLPEV